jgi:hypothetical protein
MVLQPSEERRRSGSHYTPREMTEPIVRTTLGPIVARLRSADGKPPRREAILDLKLCDPAMGSGAFLVEACRYLGDALVESWRIHNVRPEIPPDEDEVVFARRLVAQRCLYGVDRNPVAVDLAKMSLWLVTLAKDHALTFVDHAFRHGDSLVGFSPKEIESFHWEANTPRFQAGFETMRLREHMAKVAELRQRIREADESVSDQQLRNLWQEAQLEVNRIRLFGDLVVAAFFGGEKPKERETKRAEYTSAVVNGQAERYQSQLDELRHTEPPLVPFHWEIEFPEVFERENPGFDAFVGNPPFMGGSKISATLGTAYLDWVLRLHEEAHGNGDIVAHFFRRAFHFLRKGGALGFIATNTIAQGDTRTTGLSWICQHGGEIFAARKRVKWPGLAAVVVSVVHVWKGEFAGLKRIDDHVVDTITAFLFHRGGHKDPSRLTANAGLSFLGTKVYGQGFVFDDSDMKGIATPLAEMRRLLAKDRRNAQRIFPYIGGEEINTSPTYAHHRYVINFGDMTEADARRWPDLLAIVEAKVKPERMKNNREVRKKYWWRFGETTPALFAAIARLERALVIAQVSRTLAFAFLPTGMVYSHRLVVLPFDTYGSFAVLQCRAHDVWARFLGSTLKDDAVYTPSDCFETFPFPANWMTNIDLERAGKSYYEFRAALMVKHGEGLTKTYNRFHDPEEHDPEIVKLQELHAAMDRAVLEAYGWGDIRTDGKFLLDYEVDEEEWGDKRKPWRYRWPDEIQAEVLARLLELNADRARSEARSGATVEKKRGRTRGAKATPPAPGGKGLFS